MPIIDEIREAIIDLKNARENLESLRREFADEPTLLRFYEPSALALIRQSREYLDHLIRKVSGLDTAHFDLFQDEVDVWVRIEGSQFQNGEGPINLVANVLQSLNTANQHALSLIENESYAGGRFSKRISDLAMFKLADTKAGSLRLGLKRPDPSTFLVHPEANSILDPWDELKEVNKQSEKALHAFELLVKAIAAVQDDSLLEQLKSELGERSVIKLLHYAEELAPSTRSVIDRISFEAGRFDLREASADKTTRSRIDAVVRRIMENGRYVTGTGYIRQQDVDARTLTARPFKLTSGERYESLRCVFPNQVPVDEIPSYIHTAVCISGFLYLNAHGQPSRLEIDEIQEVISDGN